MAAAPPAVVAAAAALVAPAAAVVAAAGAAVVAAAGAAVVVAASESEQLEIQEGLNVVFFMVEKLVSNIDINKSINFYIVFIKVYTYVCSLGYLFNEIVSK